MPARMIKYFGLMLVFCLAAVPARAAIVKGKVIRVEQLRIHIRIASQAKVAPGDNVDLRLMIPGADSVSVGNWQVTSIDHPVVVADVVTYSGPPRVGQEALITTASVRPGAQPRDTYPAPAHGASPPVVEKADHRHTAPHIRQLLSGEADQVREGAREIYNRNLFTQDVLDVADSVLRQGYDQKKRDRLHTDAMAWLCKVLGAAGDQRYQATLERVARDAPTRKLKGYARKSLQLLRN